MTNPTNVEVRDNGKVEIRSVVGRIELRESGPPGPQGVVGPSGPQGVIGPQGPPGPPSSGSEQIFYQAIPAATWNIVHTMNGYPSVVILDSTGTVQIGDLNYVDLFHITATFGAAFSGKAILNI